MNVVWTILAAMAAYLLGTISAGEWIAKKFGFGDLRKTGSGNTGTTNVLRTMGWVPSILTLVGDCVKGVLGALLGRWAGGEMAMLICGFCAVLGHNFPVFKGFKGGKGIATSLGVTIVICPPVAPCLVLIVVVLVALTKIMSVGTLTASLSYPFLMVWLRSEGLGLPETLIFSIGMAAMSFIRHRANLVRLFKGEENKLDFGKIAQLSKKYTIHKK